MNNMQITTAPCVDAETVLESKTTQGFLQRLESVMSLSKLLRIIGVCGVLASMSLFLMEGWSQGNDIQRYLKLLAQTGLLTAAGFGVTYLLKEYKSARLFFALSLISVTANFTILGALIYSMVQWDGALIDYPAALTWQTVSAASFWPVFAGSALLLSGVSYFSFSIFNRKSAWPLTVGFLLLNSVLLLPLRESFAVACLLGVSVLIAIRLSSRLIREPHFVATPEAKFSLLTLFIPASIVLVRAVSLYNVDEVLSITLSGIAYIALRTWSTGNEVATQEQPGTLQRLAGIGQMLLAFNVAFQVMGLLPYQYSDASLFLFSAVLIASIADHCFSQRSLPMRQQFTNWVAAPLLLINLICAFVSGDGWLQTTSLLSSCAVFALTYLSDDLQTVRLQRFAVLSVVVSGLLIVANIVAALALNNWVIIGLCGGALLVAASLYERMGLRGVASTSAESAA